MRKLHRVRVAGDSMAPSLRAGESLLVDLGAYRNRGPRLGDVVVAVHPDGARRIVKRVVGLAGEQIGATTIGVGEVYLRGDNPHATTDSDEFGPVPASCLLGRAWFSTSRWRRVR